MSADDDSRAERHYDRVTPAWDAVLGEHLHHGLFDAEHPTLHAATDHLTEVLAEAVAPVAGRVVDLGCGTGAEAVWLAARDPEVHVTAVTSSPVGAERARHRVAEAELEERVSVRCHDALDGSLPAHTFDIVWMLESSQYLGPRPALLRAVAELLAPGGRAAICDVMLCAELTLRDLRRLHGDLEVLRAAFGDAVMTTPQSYRAAAVAAGLRVIDETDLSPGVSATFGHWRRRAEAARSGGLGGAELDSLIRGCDVMEHFFNAGVIGYGLLAAQAP